MGMRQAKPAGDVFRGTGVPPVFESANGAALVPVRDANFTPVSGDG